MKAPLARFAAACVAAIFVPALLGPFADRLVGEKRGEPLLAYWNEAGLFVAAAAMAVLLLFLPIAAVLNRRGRLSLPAAILLGAVTGPGLLGWLLVYYKARTGDGDGAASLLALTVPLGVLGAALFWTIALRPRRMH